MGRAGADEEVGAGAVKALKAGVIETGMRSAEFIPLQRRKSRRVGVAVNRRFPKVEAG